MTNAPQQPENGSEKSAPKRGMPLYFAVLLFLSISLQLAYGIWRIFYHESDEVAQQRMQEGLRSQQIFMQAEEAQRRAFSGFPNTPGGIGQIPADSARPD